ncbi:MAG: hypothetical protein AUK47_19240 [Deltaproteobacteria bacterium CG2_30_63_29]|nr:MAG: hypothetical protein AUK47_19240 [Deltaproteobacteria bacterium CG2_30_63_29]
MRMSPFKSLLLLSLLFVGFACTVNDPGVETGDVWECGTIEDCISGFECINRVCVKKAGIDFPCRDEDKDDAWFGPECDPATQMIDCDDANNQIHPNATELCNNQDDNCNDETDENVVLACPLTTGVCAAANAVQTCLDGNLVPPTCDADCPGATCLYGVDFVPTEGVAECHDGLDNDCDSLTDKADVANCPTCTQGEACNTITCLGSGVPENQCACKVGARVCNPDGTDSGCFLNDSPVLLPFGQAEVCGNSMDDNCDGQIDEGC